MYMGWTETVYVAKPTYSRKEKMEYVNVRYISKLCTQPQKFINELYVRACVQQFVEPCPWLEIWEINREQILVFVCCILFLKNNKMFLKNPWIVLNFFLQFWVATLVKVVFLLT